MNVFLMISIGLGILLIVGVVGWLLIGDDPPTPPQNFTIPDRSHRDGLFRAPAWRKAQVGAPPALPPYNRPLDVNPLPEDGLLPPPREVQGVNGIE